MVTFSQRAWRLSTSEVDTDRKGAGNSWETSNTSCIYKMYRHCPLPFPKMVRNESSLGILLAMLQSHFRYFALMRISFAAKVVLIFTNVLFGYIAPLGYIAPPQQSSLKSC